MHADAADVAGQCLGPFGDLHDADIAVQRTGRDVSRCQTCAPA